ncbi:para-nitrobenzyl esterase-like [Haliotis rufescens]|uniref:para-nitrobenzyl esterase-like n=1 Tax=Haliotis rufescens TaxID=6454 RepID=UPI001EAFD9FA|nr:para-nitrobenzyl esterase-like [Haliotis rufescens]
MGSLSCLVTVLILQCICSLAASVVVTTNLGDVEGVQTNRCEKFLGIKYATADRFADPAPSTWTGVLNGTTVGPACFQYCPEDSAFICQDEVSEDCLFLNVFRPLNPTSASLPVMVWIHGGNFEYFSGGSVLYDGEVIVSRGDVIFVSMNYRLGPFGFLAQSDGQTVYSGNYGIKDQRVALQWVQDNIIAFGGNPEKVTIFGDSAGAQSVAIHLTSGKADNLFSRAIMHSAPFGISFKTPAEGAYQDYLFSQNLGCTQGDMSCYKSKTADEMLTAWQGTSIYISTNPYLSLESWGPVIDGDEIKGSLVEQFETVTLSSKEVMIGSTSEESVGSIYDYYTTAVNETDYWAAMSYFQPNDFTQIVADQYPPAADDNRENLVNFMTDRLFLCSARYVAQKIREHAPAWWFIFDQPVPFREFWGDSVDCVDRVCHLADVPFLFRAPARLGFQTTPADEKVSEQMITYWLSFGIYGTPNAHWRDLPEQSPFRLRSKDLPMWLKFRSVANGATKNIRFTEPDPVIDINRNNVRCDYLDGMGYE